MADTGLFKRLQRLFSTDVIIRNEGDNKLKVFDINKIQVSGEYETNSLVDRFSRIFTNQTHQFMDTKVVLTIKQYALRFILNMTQWIQMLLSPLL
jgi:hypothetical protein